MRKKANENALKTGTIYHVKASRASSPTLRQRISGHFARLKRWIGTHKRVSIFIVGMLIALLVFGGYEFFKDIPSPTKLKSQSFPVSTKIFDRNGTLLYEIYADRNRTPIKLSDLPPYVYQASIAIEDKNFYQHHGFDFLGMIRALGNTFFHQSLQGGSTITQQLVKTSLLTSQRTITRKIKEALLTVATETLYSKNDILEMYVNNIPYGGTAWGIEAAAHTYFGKDAKDLTLAEAALLAGLPASPTTYSPFGSHPDQAVRRQKEVLARMVDSKFITQDQANQAMQQPLKFATDAINIKAPHFVFYVKDILENEYSDQLIERGGLRVYTTLDLNIQEQAEASISAELKKLKNYRIGNAAALVTDPKTGEILAMVGSQNYFDATHDGQVNVTIRDRQPGSSIKPLNYVTAFETKKLTPASMMLDIPTCFNVTGQAPYCPVNYDGAFHGAIQERFALGNSLNIPAVKTLAVNSLQTFMATASAMGISTWSDPSHYGLSLTLGGGEVTMTDMATAYGVLANEGVRVNLQPILRVEDYTGKVYQSYNPDETSTQVDELTAGNGDPVPVSQVNPNTEVQRVLHRAPTYLISHILLDNGSREAEFGPNSALVVPGQVVSVKTGTTNDIRDNWTIGYTPHFLTAVWVGNNDNTPMNQALVSGITGAAPIWNDIMRFVLKNQKPTWPDQPSDIVNANICVVTGLLPNPASPCQTRSEFFWNGTQPTTIENSPQAIFVDPTTGVPPAPGTNVPNLQAQTHILVSDPFTQNFCLDCTRPVDDKGHTQYESYNVNIFEPHINTTTPVKQ
ncbi:penicillin-binding protein [Candidatus Cerribacteria bacterium 'Amazon FNV 2010 28 9']|uniref:Penicillin-binding protein n=1 Tax=Candidatus Cerribacteria bacterium 'Amazon FNV 2010 28 9' TaxID=2081795 RepID=A0A317JNE0_9BACT|nr:MAG: penicillin-binding protein [Candidatus Cerribacteria bacterium 'Amazon FNV 2010 28 9']